MKIIFLTNNGFIPQHLTDLYVREIGSVYPVELWDLSPVYQREAELSQFVENRKVFATIDEFNAALAALSENSIIITNILFYSLPRIYKVIKKYPIDLMTITKEGLTSYLFDRNLKSLTTSISLTDIIKFLIKNIFPLRYLFNRIVNRNAKFDYLFAANNFFPEYTRRFIKIHHIKYDEFLQAKTLERTIDEPYAVFLDSSVTTHPMYKRKKLKNIQEDIYIHLLNRYFDFVEQEYHVKVIISAHPKSDFSSATFNGRPIIKSQTPVLIEHSEFVLSHFSTSVVNAILGYKPIVFLTAKEMLQSAQRFVAIGGLEYAKALKSPVVDLNQIQKVDLTVDQAAYTRFIERFIINPEKRDQNNASIILNFLEEYESNTKQ